LFQIIQKRLTLQGFIVSDFQSQFPDALKDLKQWYQEGRIRSKETIFEGLDKSIEAIQGLFTGANIGKTVVKVAD